MKKIVMIATLATVMSGTVSAKGWNEYIEEEKEIAREALIHEIAKEEIRSEMDLEYSSKKALKRKSSGKHALIVGTAGQIEVSGMSVNKFGLDAAQAVREDEVGFAFGMGLATLSEETTGLIDIDLIEAHIGLSYGLTDNISFIPTVGGSLAKTDIDEEIGFNLGADLLYTTPKGFVAGVGVRYHTVSDLDFNEINFKVGYSF